jgi:uncharacterized membrane protein (DUF485 family)
MGSHAVVKGRIFSLLQLPAIVGLILGILGGMKFFNKNPDTQSEGHTFQKAAVILYLILLIVLIAINALTFVHSQHIIPRENRLAIATGLSIPFLCVRIIYSMIVVFNPNSSIFGIQSRSKTATIVQALMAILMEFIVVAIYLVAGFTVPVISRAQVRPGYQPARGGSLEGNYPLRPIAEIPKHNNTASHGAQQQGVV